MHELQLMRQVVSKVEEICQRTPGTTLSLIRVDIASHSHLARHTPGELQTTFQLAAQGTSIEHATLAIRILPAQGVCRLCGHSFERTPETFDCPRCSSMNIEWEDRPELILTDIEMHEVSR